MAELNPQENQESSAENTSVDVENTKNSASEEENASENTAALETKPEQKEEEATDEAQEDVNGEDQDAEVKSDEHEEDSTKDELPDYSNWSAPELVKEAAKLLASKPVQNIKAEMDSIRLHLLNQLDEERKEKLHQFVEDGGNEIDFEFIQPLRKEFNQTFKDYRSKRKAYYDDLRDQLEKNLLKRNALIERLKHLTEEEESFGETYKHFKEIQDEWHTAGPIPHANSNEVYRNYHFHLEKFYDYLRLNKELRDLDFKKNRAVKEQLCEAVENLYEKEDILDAFRDLQQLHKKWKQSGPVEPELREPLWERFSEATRKMHDKRTAFEEELKVQNEERIALKKKICDQLESIDLSKIKTHQNWQKIIQAMDEAREQFKRIGRVPLPDNDLVWDRFREISRNVNRAKNAFYKELKHEQQHNLKRKKELLAKAEELKDSTDWKGTAQALKKMQSDWKNIGAVNRAESEKIWKDFRSACNHFFDRLTAYNKDLDKVYEGHYDDKKVLLEELKSSEKENITPAVLKNFMKRWKDIGSVPRDKRTIESEWNKLLDNLFASIKMDKEEGLALRYQNKLESLLQEGGIEKIKREQSGLREKRKEAERELLQLETNSQRFTGDKNNPFMKEVSKNIQKHQEQIESIKRKLKLVKTFIENHSDEKSSESQ